MKFMWSKSILFKVRECKSCIYKEAANANLEKEEDDQDSKASSEVFVTNNDPYYSYNHELFDHDEASTPGLGED